VALNVGFDVLLTTMATGCVSLAGAEAPRLRAGAAVLSGSPRTRSWSNSAVGPTTRSWSRLACSGRHPRAPVEQPPRGLRHVLCRRATPRYPGERLRGPRSVAHTESSGLPRFQRVDPHDNTIETCSIATGVHRQFPRPDVHRQEHSTFSPRGLKSRLAHGRHRQPGSTMPSKLQNCTDRSALVPPTPDRPGVRHRRRAGHRYASTIFQLPYSHWITRRSWPARRST
jgi:hypothetical protein